MWNMVTAAPEKVDADAPAKPGFVDPDAAKPDVSADHCAPSISKAERFKRLSKYGAVRETGLNEYSAGSKSITFLSPTELLNCR